MNETRPIRRAAAAALLALGAVAPGCVFDDIHEELVTINSNMKVTQDILLDANATLDVVRGQLEQVQRTNDLLVELQAGLGTEATAATRTENRMSIIGTMEAIDRSLGAMDVHLSALRRTIANIDSTIPFLKFAAEDEEEEEDAPGVDGEGTATATVEAPDADDPGMDAPPNQPQAQPQPQPQSDPD